MWRRPSTRLLLSRERRHKLAQPLALLSGLPRAADAVRAVSKAAGPSRRGRPAGVTVNVARNAVTLDLAVLDPDALDALQRLIGGRGQTAVGRPTG